jgi:hypothetical protein
VSGCRFSVCKLMELEGLIEYWVDSCLLSVFLFFGDAILYDS